MKKKLIVIISAITLVLSFITSLPASAYTASSELFNHVLNSTGSFTFNDDGIFLINVFCRSSYDPLVLSSGHHYLDLTSFTSGTWQGQPVSELSSLRLVDQSDTVGFSYITSFTDEGNYFLYSITYCLPVVAGDSFSLKRSTDSNFCTSSCANARTSYIPGGTGIKRAYSEQSTSHCSSLSYTIKSDNQYLVILYCPDLFTTTGCTLSTSSPDKVGLDYSNITRVGSVPWFSVYTSNYGLPSGSDLSLSLNDSIDNYSFSVYEIFTDGNFYPGEDTGEDSGGTGDGSSINVDLSGVESRLDEIIYLLESGGAGFSPAEFWEVYREGLIELFGLEAAEPSEPPPEDVTESPTSPLDVGVDKEQFDEALSYVNTDLGDTVTGSGGAIAFFWFITDKFLSTTGLYVVVALSLIFSLGTWLLRS